jgi:hypothetical protein
MNFFGLLQSYLDKYPSSLLDLEEDSIVSCDETDDGLDYYKKGSVSDTRGLSATDVCSDTNQLIEFKCEDSGKVSGSYLFDCPHGCSDGACIENVSEEVTTCSETDNGKDYYNKGNTANLDGIGTDKCKSPCEDNEDVLCDSDSYLLEYYCENGVSESEFYKCQNGCEDGACLDTDSAKEASDEDNIDLYESEVLTNETVDLSQTCNGCLVNGKCYNIGYREADEYCNNMQEKVAQAEAGSACENSFECKSNLCIDNECISEGFFKKIMNWFKRFFG